VHEGELGLRPAADDRHDAVTDAEAMHAVTRADDLARQFKSGDVGGAARWWRVPPRHLHQVRAVEPGGMHAHEQLAVPRDGVIVFAPLERPVDDRDGAHSAH
jgi:hypothetical protein